MKTAYTFLFGTLIIEYEDDVLLGLSCKDETYRISEEEIQARTRFTDMVMKQINEYLQGKRKSFEIQYKLEGTAFQRKVWNALLTIPYGSTCTYKQIAEMIGNPKASRAVGMANNKNPILILVPCHRVIGANGNLTGYAGGLSMKEYLLKVEKTYKT